MSDSLQHHGLQPARLLCPWNSPGKNTGLGCLFLLQEIFWMQGMNLGLLHRRWIFTNWATILVLGTIVLCLVSRVQLCDPMDYSQSGSSDHGDSPGKNTGVGCHALLQGIFPTQGLNLGLLNCRQILYCLSHQGSPLGTINENQI